jgi:hypothetical protein
MDERCAEAAQAERAQHAMELAAWARQPEADTGELRRELVAAQSEVRGAVELAASEEAARGEAETAKDGAALQGGASGARHG